MGEVGGKPFPSKRELERALRGAGLTARQAKRLLSCGYAALGMDDAPLDIAALAEQAEALAKQLRSSCREIPQG